MDKPIRIDENIHTRAKVAATLRGESLKRFTEAALLAKLNGDKRTTDRRTPYRVETEEA